METEASAPATLTRRSPAGDFGSPSWIMLVSAVKLVIVPFITGGRSWTGPFIISGVISTPR